MLMVSVGMHFRACAGDDVSNSFVIPTLVNNVAPA